MKGDNLYIASLWHTKWTSISIMTYNARMCTYNAWVMNILTSWVSFRFYTVETVGPPRNYSSYAYLLHLFTMLLGTDSLAAHLYVVLKSLSSLVPPDPTVTTLFNGRNLGHLLRPSCFSLSSIVWDLHRVLEQEESQFWILESCVLLISFLIPEDSIIRVVGPFLMIPKLSTGFQ